MPVFTEDLSSGEQTAARNSIHTPEGGFATVAATATWYGLSLSAVVFRLRSPAFPDWTSPAFPKLRTSGPLQGNGCGPVNIARRIRCSSCGGWFDSHSPSERVCRDCPGGDRTTEGGHW